MKLTTPKVKKKILVQISWAVSILFLAQNIISGLGEIWGFEKVVDQIAATMVKVAAPLEVVFLGKILTEKDKETENETKN